MMSAFASVSFMTGTTVQESAGGCNPGGRSRKNAPAPAGAPFSMYEAQSFQTTPIAPVHAQPMTPESRRRPKSLENIHDTPS
jgi:hypothetical protein